MTGGLICSEMVERIFLALNIKDYVLFIFKALTHKKHKIDIEPQSLSKWFFRFQNALYAILLS